MGNLSSLERNTYKIKTKNSVVYANITTLELQNLQSNYCDVTVALMLHNIVSITPGKYAINYGHDGPHAEEVLMHNEFDTYDECIEFMVNNVGKYKYL